MEKSKEGIPQLQDVGFHLRLHHLSLCHSSQPDVNNSIFSTCMNYCRMFMHRDTYLVPGCKIARTLHVNRIIGIIIDGQVVFQLSFDPLYLRSEHDIFNFNIKLLLCTNFSSKQNNIMSSPPLLSLTSGAGTGWTRRKYIITRRVTNRVEVNFF